MAGFSIIVIVDHNHKNEKEIEKKSHCVCYEKCLCWGAEKITVNCGCKMEAKQFEYKMNKKCCHIKHVHDGERQKDGNIIYTCPMHPEAQKTEPGNCGTLNVGIFYYCGYKCGIIKKDRFGAECINNYR